MREREMRYQEDGAALAAMVRVGIVTAADNDKRLVQVQFRDTEISSGWIPVLINRDFVPDYEGTQKTEVKAGGSGEASFAGHTHELTIRPWMPKVNEQVLVLYEPIRDGQGFVLGGIQPWQ